MEAPGTTDQVLQINWLSIDVHGCDSSAESQCLACGRQK